MKNPAIATLFDITKMMYAQEMIYDLTFYRYPIPGFF